MRRTRNVPAGPVMGDFPLTAREQALIHEQVMNVWQAIAPDLCEQPTDNDEAIEVCLDANHLSTFGGAEGRQAESLIRHLGELYGHEAVTTAISHVVRLV